ncbi:MAG TPA: peptide-methionine (S)-S-oxide reductase MsrA [Dongiaceae bacterium]|nr:peptide-methionine (S)-S-oxide reductase MsrA [Dongiaceae bacterium]
MISKRQLLVAALALSGLAAWMMPSSAEEARVIPAPAIDEQPAQATSEIALLAGGCFWGVQGVFQHVDGVTSAVSGYAGGEAETAQYKLVGRGDTGHAESVQITYDPRKISYGKILQIYFSVAHDPTQLNYQGPDMGPQYRSTIFPTTDEQARIAKAYIAQLDQAHIFGDAIVTTLEPGKVFYPAEDYHQDFLTLNPTYPYIVYNDLPKIENLKRIFPGLYREQPVLVLAGQPSN